jgi:hypothetical protein
MNSIFMRSDRFSAAILNSMGNDSQADRERLDQLMKALQFIAATTSPVTAPFLRFAFDGIERLSKRSVLENQQPLQRQMKQRCRTAKGIGTGHLCSPASRSSVRI